LGFWEWLNITRSVLKLVSLGESKNTFEGRNDAFGSHLVETFDQRLVLIDELLAEDLVLDMESLDMPLEVLNNLDGI
jgi:hypothetical protein